jgi:hypothetical protein
MFITFYFYHVKPGTIPAILCLYQEWQQILTNWNLLSTELLANVQDPTEMVMLARFKDEDAAWAAAESIAHCTWYGKLVNLTEEGPRVDHYQTV